MGTSNGQSDQAWGALKSMAADEREARMAQRYREMASLPEEEMLSRMRAMVRAEYNLPDAELRPFTLSRLRTWLALDMDTVHKIAACYDAAMLEMSGPTAMRRVATVQTLARDFPREDRERLAKIVPAVFAGYLDVGQRVHAVAAPPQKEVATTAKGGWWPFGKGKGKAA